MRCASAYRHVSKSFILLCTYYGFSLRDHSLGFQSCARHVTPVLHVARARDPSMAPFTVYGPSIVSATYGKSWCLEGHISEHFEVTSSGRSRHRSGSGNIAVPDRLRYRLLVCSNHSGSILQSEVPIDFHACMIDIIIIRQVVNSLQLFHKAHQTDVPRCNQPLSVYVGCLHVISLLHATF